MKRRLLSQKAAQSAAPILPSHSISGKGAQLRSADVTTGTKPAHWDAALAPATSTSRLQVRQPVCAFLHNSFPLVMLEDLMASKLRCKCDAHD